MGASGVDERGTREKINRPKMPNESAETAWAVVGRAPLELSLGAASSRSKQLDLFLLVCQTTGVSILLVHRASDYRHPEPGSESVNPNMSKMKTANLKAMELIIPDPPGPICR